MNRKNNFTIVELIVVIGVIGILAGILLPTLGIVKEKGKKTQAASEAKSIYTAVHAFYSDYQYLPSKDAAGARTNDIVISGSVNAQNPSATGDLQCDVQTELNTSYINFFDTLCYSKQSGKATDAPADDSNAAKFNPKKTKYLTPPKNYFSSDKKTNGFRDPWDRSYIIYLDTDYDGNVEGIYNKFGLSGSENILSDIVGVVSLGSEPPATAKFSNADQNGVATSWE